MGYTAFIIQSILCGISTEIIKLIELLSFNVMIVFQIGKNRPNAKFLLKFILNPGLFQLNRSHKLLQIILLLIRFFNVHEIQ